MLGVSKTASASEIKAAYKQMATQYHPDKVSHLGKELIDFAGKKFIEINKAYENIKKEKGF
jgi:DnaJ like chaperone protein